MSGFFDYIRFYLPGWKDLVQIAVLAFLIYRILILWSGTRAFQILFGLVVLLGIYAMANVLGLAMFETVLSQVFTYGAFALIVVFQPELRSALAQLGRNRVLTFLTRLEPRGEEVADEVAKAAEQLSRKRIGAIIAIQRELDLELYVQKDGTPLRADVSADLLVSIFTPRSPLHDGAVVIRGGEIIGAGVTLPLSQYPLADRSLGTRHSAALGLSEETDAYVIVVSEETSQISLARRGVLRRGLQPEQLRTRIAADADPSERRSLEKDRSDRPREALESGSEAERPSTGPEGPETAAESGFDGEDEVAQPV
ncbi:MAG: diadenylate cyclase CdaA [Gemmatimonadota bacterium]|nr:diadenylate cyclase CdaA [Gemmatimonadota bacterium]